MELLKSFKHLRTTEDISDIKELLSLYYEHKLDAAINKVEDERGYTAAVYETWLSEQQRKSA